MTMTLVSTVTVGSGGASSIEWTGIAGTGKDLLVLISSRQNQASAGLTLRLNGDTGNNYVGRRLQGDGSTASSVDSGTSTSLNVYAVARSDSTASTFGNGSIYISNYTSTSNKSISNDGVSENNATLANQYLVAGSYTSSSAITSITIQAVVGSFVQHSTASLYIIS